MTKDSGCFVLQRVASMAARVFPESEMAHFTKYVFTRPPYSDALPKGRPVRPVVRDTSPFHSPLMCPDRLVRVYILPPILPASGVSSPRRTPRAFQVNSKLENRPSIGTSKSVHNNGPPKYMPHPDALPLSQLAPLLECGQHRPFRDPCRHQHPTDVSSSK